MASAAGRHGEQTERTTETPGPLIATRFRGGPPWTMLGHCPNEHLGGVPGCRANPGFDHVVTAMRAQVEAIHAYRADAHRARDPEDVHRMRVAVRRLRAILRASGSLSDDEMVEGLRRELKWLGIALGRVRDFDVLRAQLRAQLGRRPAGGPAARRRLMQHIADDRARAVSGLRAALDGRRYGRLLVGSKPSSPLRPPTSGPPSSRSCAEPSRSCRSTRAPRSCTRSGSR